MESQQPSQPSNSASETGGRGFSPNEAQERLDQARKALPTPAEPKKLAASMPKMPNSGSSSGHDEARYQQQLERQRLREQSEREQRIASIMRSSGLPKRHVESHGKQEIGTPWHDAMQQAVEAVNGGNSVLLCGPRGRGKTQIAVACGHAIAMQTHSVRYCKAAELFRECRESMHDGKESSAINALCRVGLLIVDEAHVRVDTDYEDRILTEIADRRYDSLKPTLLITNQTREQSAKSLGPSIVSRFHEAGVVIECDWESFRR